MPLLSASIRAALAGFLLAAFWSCASTPPAREAPLPGAVAGTIRISGSHPYERQLVLESETGDYWLLHSSTLEGELLQLDGQIVRAHGMTGSGLFGTRELSVEWYELLAPPGLVACVGTLGSYRDTLVLLCDIQEETASIELLIDGPLRESLGHFVGYRVWISGEPVGSGTEVGAGSEATGVREGSSEAGVRAAVSGRVQVRVREYGVLGPPTSPLRDAPHSTFPDSCR
jgi:hypothetical protein